MDRLLPGGTSPPMLEPLGGGGGGVPKESPAPAFAPQAAALPAVPAALGHHHHQGQEKALPPPMAFLVWPPSYSPHFCPPPSLQPLSSNERFVVGQVPGGPQVQPSAVVPRFPQQYMLVPTRGDEEYLRTVQQQQQQQRRPSLGEAESPAPSSCLICLQPTPAVSAARGVHVRALLLCSCIKMMRERGSTPVPDVRRNYVKSCRACRYWLELGIKKIEALTKSAGVNIQDLLAAQSRYWASQPAAEPKRVHEPVLGYFSPHPDDMRPRSLRKPLIDFVKKNVTQEMICDFQLRLAKVAPARRVTMEEDPLSMPVAPVPALESEPRVTYDEPPNDLAVPTGPHDVDDDDDSAATPRFFNI
mmetsp:Transcript_22272/g.69720  ORF Transcript_22272/g.69720 Transcript_22272/m.69720 type:complete len:359 (-) Transcript_22272:508-1584(-)